MRFSEKIKLFIDASANVITGNMNYPDSEYIFDLKYSALQTIADGKRNMKSDLKNFSSDFRKVTNEAKQHVKDGKAASTKQNLEKY